MPQRSRQRVMQALTHGSPDRPPFDAIGFPSDLAAKLCGELGLGAEESAYFTDGELRYIEYRFAGERGKFVPYLPGLPANALLDEFGVGRLPLFTAEGYVAGHTYFHPLAAVDTPEGLERFPFPDVTDAACHAHIDPEVAEAHGRGFAVVGQMSQTILESSYCMRGMERLFCDFTERPAFVRALFQRIGDIRVVQAERFARAGVDVLRIGDDIATQAGLIIGPVMYREWIKPHHARVIAAARAINPDIQVLYHSDGNLTGLLPDLIDAGVTAVNPCQPEAMDLLETRRRYGDRLTLWGCTPTQSIYAAGSARDVERNTRWLMDLGRAGTASAGPACGGVIIQFYNMLVTPRVTENLRHFISTFCRVAEKREQAHA